MLIHEKLGYTKEEFGMFKETIAVYCGDKMKQLYPVGIAELLNATASDTHSYLLIMKSCNWPVVSMRTCSVRDRLLLGKLLKAKVWRMI
jgi:hypothetical protein